MRLGVSEKDRGGIYECSVHSKGMHTRLTNRLMVCSQYMLLISNLPRSY